LKLILVTIKLIWFQCCKIVCSNFCMICDKLKFYSMYLRFWVALSIIFLCSSVSMAQCDNVALGKAVTASASLPGAPSQNAVDGDCSQIWNAGNYAPQSLDIDLGVAYTINNINIMFEMSPNGNVNYEILTSPDMVTWNVVDVITGFYVTGQLVERCYSSAPLTGVRGVRVSALASPSWIAIRDMGVYTLSSPAIPTITVSGPLTICQGSSVTLTASTAYTYLWSTGETTQSITVNSAGTYSVTTNQSPACTQGTIACTTCGVGTNSVVVNAAPPPVVSVSPNSIVGCYNSSAVVTASGASTYSWSPGTNLSANSGATVTVGPLSNTTYTVTGTDSLGCTANDTVQISAGTPPNVSVKASAVSSLCDSSKLNWAAWSSVSGSSGIGGISSDLTITVSKPTGGLSTTGGMYNGGIFPTQYNVPVNNTAIRNDLAGLFTFCFNRPVVNPQIALSSIGSPGNSVQINTSDPYLVIWQGQGMSYPNNTTFVGTEGYTIIQFPGVHTCISFDYLQSETYCNLAFGTLDTNCQVVAPPPICAGTPDTLIASGALNYSWSPAAGLNVTSGAVVVATPTVTTTYYVTGTDASNCADMDSITITVKPFIIAPLITGDTIICAGDSTTLTASSGGIGTTYLWKPINMADSVHSFKPASTSPYTVVATNVDGCSDSSSVNIVVNLLPQAQFSALPVCKNNSTVFNNSSTGNISNWDWSYGDGAISTLQSPSHIYATCDSFIVKLTVTTVEGCIDSTTKIARVYCLPFANFMSTDACVNQAVSCTDVSVVAGSTIATWSWNFGDNSAIVSSQNPTHPFSVDGAHTISLLITSSQGCVDSTTRNSIVHPLPVAKFSASNVCDGDIVVFSNSSAIAAPDAIQAWAWSFGDSSAINNNQNATHLYSAVGSYTSKLVVVSDFGCIDSTTHQVVVSPNPVVNFTTVDSSGCAPLCLSLQNQSTIFSGNNVQWSWDVGDGSGFTTSQSFDHCYQNSGVSTAAYFSVSLTVVSDSGCTSMITKNNYITVFPNPQAAFSITPSTTDITNAAVSIIDESLGADFWNWNFGDTVTSTSANPLPHVYTDTGSFVITLITSTQHGCYDTAYQNAIINPTFTFYVPNAFTPNGDGENDTFGGTGIFIKEYKMTIFDRWGNLIYKTDTIDKPWDGKVNYTTTLAVQDTYVYLIEVTDFKKQKHQYRGIVSVLRGGY
jgi:gliding motility-associated-like protein